MNKATIFIILFIAGAYTSAQDTLKGFVAQSLGTNINTEQHELNPVLSYDGKILYFTREDSVKDKYWHERPQYIYRSLLLNDGTWSKAEKMPANINTGLYNSVVGVSSKGDTLFLNGVFTKKTNRWYKRGLSYSVKIDSTQWTNPREIKVKALSRLNRGAQSNMRMALGGKYLFLSFTKRTNGKRNDIYRAERYKDIYLKPKRLKKPIKHAKADEAPFLSEDGKTLYFTTERFSKESRGLEVVKSKSIDDKYLEWTEPVRLSDSVNSPVWDSYYMTNTRGSWAYFCSHSKSFGGADIFKVKIFEEFPFVLIKGKVLALGNKTGNTPLDNVKVYYNDKPVDSLKIGNGGTFQLMLPLGAKYNLRAESKNYVSDSILLVDVSSVKEYTEREGTLYVKPANASVTGKLLTTEGKVFAKDAEPKLYVNGKELTQDHAEALGIDTYEVDFENGKYFVKLPLHKKYGLEIRAKESNPVPATVDLTKLSEYKEINKDLFAAPAPKVVDQKIASFSGRIINKKTGKVITGNADMKIQVNETDLLTATLDTSKGTYAFDLPLGSKYVINAKAPKFYPEYEQIDLSKEKDKVKIIKDLVLSPIEKGQSIKLKNIFFDFGKSTLKKESFPELDKLYNFLVENPEIKVEIAGHTDNKGLAEKNMQLSRWRARSVQLYLVQKGVDIKRVTFNGYGLSKPVASNKTEAGRALNRRVEFTILEH